VIVSVGVDVDDLGKIQCDMLVTYLYNEPHNSDSFLSLPKPLAMQK
jgi:hypothetical protein